MTEEIKSESIQKAYEDWPGWKRKCEHCEQWGPMEQTFEAGYRAGFEAASSVALRTTSPEELLSFYRRVMDHIHEGGNIYYDKGRMAAYCMIALFASDVRRRRDTT